MESFLSASWGRISSFNQINKMKRIYPVDAPTYLEDIFWELWNEGGGKDEIEFNIAYPESPLDAWLKTKTNENTVILDFSFGGLVVYYYTVNFMKENNDGDMVVKKQKDKESFAHPELFFLQTEQRFENSGSFEVVEENYDSILLQKKRSSIFVQYIYLGNNQS